MKVINMLDLKISCEDLVVIFLKFVSSFLLLLIFIISKKNWLINKITTEPVRIEEERHLLDFESFLREEREANKLQEDHLIYQNIKIRTAAEMRKMRVIEEAKRLGLLEVRKVEVEKGKKVGISTSVMDLINKTNFLE